MLLGHTNGHRAAQALPSSDVPPRFSFARPFSSRLHARPKLKLGKRVPYWAPDRRFHMYYVEKMLAQHLK